MKKSVVTVFALCALLLALLPASTAHAGPQSRENVVVHEAAALAEVMAHYKDQTRAYPGKLSNKRAKKLLDYNVAKKARIVHYKRTHGGRDYRLCVVHANGGWATWNTRTRDIKSSGRARPAGSDRGRTVLG